MDVCDGPLRSRITLFLLFVLVVPRIIAFFTYGFHALWAPQARQISQLFLLFILETLILMPVTHFAVVAPFSQFNPLVRALFHLECLATRVVNNRHLPLLTSMGNAARDTIDAMETNITRTRNKCLYGHVVWPFGLILATPLQPYSMVQQCKSQINLEVVTG